MKKEMVRACAGCVPRGSAVVSLRSGMAKDKLIFIIICSVAIGVAVITMASFLLPRSRSAGVGQWQCLEQGHEFNTKTFDYPPIDCPKCGGEAVKVTYRKCPSCGKNIMCYRRRLSAQGQALRDAMRKRAEAAGQSVGVPSPMLMMYMETQYRLKQPDGSFAWSDWLSAGSAQQFQIQSSLRCPECGAILFPQSSRSRGSRN